ncbi:hypothetical protein ACFS27_13295 [Promicromonospora vindobonensis]|uniref:Uncharacterized protein n=1 Tax=Promicromonospora vindobonensis TaxID=195748 RepID=A0ABW5VVG1_9MICO
MTAPFQVDSSTPRSGAHRVPGVGGQVLVGESADRSSPLTASLLQALTAHQTRHVLVTDLAGGRLSTLVKAAVAALGALLARGS